LWGSLGRTERSTARAEAAVTAVIDDRHMCRRQTRSMTARSSPRGRASDGSTTRLRRRPTERSASPCRLRVFAHLDSQRPRHAAQAPTSAREAVPHRHLRPHGHVDRPARASHRRTPVGFLCFLDFRVEPTPRRTNLRTIEVARLSANTFETLDDTWICVIIAVRGLGRGD